MTMTLTDYIAELETEQRALAAALAWSTHVQRAVTEMVAAAGLEAATIEIEEPWSDVLIRLRAPALSAIPAGQPVPAHQAGEEPVPEASEVPPADEGPEHAAAEAPQAEAPVAGGASAHEMLGGDQGGLQRHVLAEKAPVQAAEEGQAGAPDVETLPAAEAFAATPAADLPDPGPNRPWTEADKRQLIVLAKLDVPTRAIAQQLGRTPQAIGLMRSKLALETPPEPAAAPEPAPEAADEPAEEPAPAAVRPGVPRLPEDAPVGELKVQMHVDGLKPPRSLRNNPDLAAIYRDVFHFLSLGWGQQEIATELGLSGGEVREIVLGIRACRVSDATILRVLDFRAPLPA